MPIRKKVLLAMSGDDGFGDVLADHACSAENEDVPAFSHFRRLCGG